MAKPLQLEFKKIRTDGNRGIGQQLKELVNSLAIVLYYEQLDA